MKKAETAQIKTATIAATGTTPVGFWDDFAVITKTKLKFRSQGDWDLNTTVEGGGDSQYNYLFPTESKQVAKKLSKMGFGSSVGKYGEHVLLKPFDEAKFLA